MLQQTTTVEIPGLVTVKLGANTKSRDTSFEFVDITVAGIWKDFSSTSIISSLVHQLSGIGYIYCNPTTLMHSPIPGVYDQNAVTAQLSTRMSLHNTLTAAGNHQGHGDSTTKVSETPRIAAGSEVFPTRRFKSQNVVGCINNQNEVSKEAKRLEERFETYDQ